jgi:hypothetical protein
MLFLHHLILPAVYDVSRQLLNSMGLTMGIFSLTNIYVYISGDIWIVKPIRNFTTLQEYIILSLASFEEKQMLTVLLLLL